ncbi:MAG TPA: hypothetical protein VFG69_00510, partial [Nannocystaceae bacterium]|nr:hypothetical protein [Nannocystaceae bacterium]
MTSDPEILEIRDERIGLVAYLAVATPAHKLCFGGMRVDEGVTRELVVDLAETMALKLAPH